MFSDPDAASGEESGVGIWSYRYAVPYRMHPAGRWDEGAQPPQALRPEAGLRETSQNPHTG